MTVHPTHTCFDDALDYLELLAKHDGLTQDDFDPYRVVHGICTMPDGEGYVHAWVENGNEAIGCGFVNGIRIYYLTPRREFYRNFRPQEMVRYTVREALEQNLRTGHYGPWENYYQQLIKQQHTREDKHMTSAEEDMANEIRQLLDHLKADIADEYRCTDDPDDNTAGMLVTVSTRDMSTWHYQTGDNSFTGACYGDPHWSVIYLYRDSNTQELARDAVNELADTYAEHNRTTQTT